MIIQCEKCRTKFRLDDSRVSDKGVKVRCTKCKYVFRVQADLPEVKSAPPEGASIGSTPAAPSVPPQVAAIAPVTAPFEHGVADADAERTLLDAPDRFNKETSESFDPSEFSFEPELSPDSSEVKAKEEAGDVTEVGGEVDFSDFDFGDSLSDVDSPAASVAPVNGVTAADKPEPAPFAAHQKEIPQGLDFSDDMFGAVVPPAPEAANDPISFDFEGDSFAESMDMGSRQSPVKSGGGPLFALDTPGEAPFALGDIDFGEELTSVAVQQVNPEDLHPAQKTLFAPLADAQAVSLHGETAADLGEQQELPPLSIPSRRKQSPLFTGLIAAVALLVVAVLGYFGYTSFSAPKETASAESGKIGIRSVKAAYIDNPTTGELLVVSGEALNEYPKPRAALQVKVTVFDSTGQSVSSKSAYGGNPLTEEQLKNLPLEKIEAAMANQFGDSLANMEVAPGKAIPFVVVLAHLPKGAKDFGVQPAGSTVATGKQQ